MSHGEQLLCCRILGAIVQKKLSAVKKSEDKRSKDTETNGRMSDTVGGTKRAVNKHAEPIRLRVLGSYPFFSSAAFSLGKRGSVSNSRSASFPQRRMMGELMAVVTSVPRPMLWKEA